MKPVKHTNHYRFLELDRSFQYQKDRYPFTSLNNKQSNSKKLFEKDSLK